MRLFSGLDCDIRNNISTKPRFVGGPNACRVKPHSKPWIVSLGFKENPLSGVCAGTLITKNHVLSAAHCVCDRFEIPPDCKHWQRLSAVVGEHDTETNDGEQIVEIDNVIVFEKYSGKWHL